MFNFWKNFFHKITQNWKLYNVFVVCLFKATKRQKVAVQTERMFVVIKKGTRYKYKIIEKVNTISGPKTKQTKMWKSCQPKIPKHEAKKFEQF